MKDGEKEDGVAKIETTTDELKPTAKKEEKSETPASEPEEPLFKSNLHVKQPKSKVSWVWATRLSPSIRVCLFLTCLVCVSVMGLSEIS
jgi:hypothetical protein